MVATILGVFVKYLKCYGIYRFMSNVISVELCDVLFCSYYFVTISNLFHIRFCSREHSFQNDDWVYNVLEWYMIQSMNLVFVLSNQCSRVQSCHNFTLLVLCIFLRRCSKYSKKIYILTIQENNSNHSIQSNTPTKSVYRTAGNKWG